MQSVSFAPTAETTKHVHAVRTRRVKGKYIYSERLFIAGLCKIVPMAVLNVKNERKVIKERGAFLHNGSGCWILFFFFLSHFTFLPAWPCVPVFCSSVSAADVDSSPVVSRAHVLCTVFQKAPWRQHNTAFMNLVFFFFSNRGASAYFFFFFLFFFFFQPNTSKQCGCCCCCCWNEYD